MPIDHDQIITSLARQDEAIDRIEAATTKGFSGVFNRLDVMVLAVTQTNDRLSKVEHTHSIIKSVGKWSAGIAATVIGAVLLLKFGLR